MNVLSIGNSFSMDAQRYIHRIARADGFALTTVNLYIGGCALSRHHRNMLSEERAYELEVNGERSGFFVSLKEALLNRDWDIITLQQVSGFSVNYDTYQPYLNELVSYVRKFAPKAKLAIHQTWAYEEGSERLVKELGYKSHADMFTDVEKAYEKAAKDVGADMIIPSGEALERLISKGVEKVHRDTYHLSYGLGRYTVGLLWYSVLSGNDITENTFADLDEEVSEREIALAKESVSETVKNI